MKKKFLKTLVISGILITNIIGVTAFAETSGNFRYLGKTVVYSLTKGPGVGSNYNYADAKTSFPKAVRSDGYVVTSYAEAVDSAGKRIGDGVFAYDTLSAVATKGAYNVSAFHGSHSIAHSSNVYSPEHYTWTNVAQ